MYTRQGFRATLLMNGRIIAVIYEGHNIGIMEMMRDEITGQECYRVTALDGWQNAEYSIENAISFLIEHSKSENWVEPVKDNRRKRGKGENVKYELSQTMKDELKLWDEIAQGI